MPRVRALLTDALDKAAILSRRGGPDDVAAMVRSGLRAVGLLERGGPPSPEDLASLGYLLFEPEELTPEALSFMLRSRLSTTRNRIGSYVAIFFTAGIRRGLWETEGSHNF